jgi:hypothetical protein
LLQLVFDQLKPQPQTEESTMAKAKPAPMPVKGGKGSKKGC